MKLDIFDYVYNKGLPDEWRVEEWQLSKTNLIVGKNASGKSKIVRAIYTLSELLSNSRSLLPQSKSYEWRLLFDIERSEEKTEYILKIEKGLVIKEKLIIGSKSDRQLLNRDESGKGTILAKELNRKINFQTDQTELAVVKRRDSIQHPFLEKLYQWSNSLRFYEFGTELGKNFIWAPPFPRDRELSKNEIKVKDARSVVGIFVLGKQEFRERFTEAIISDMTKIGYQLSEVGIKVPSSINSDISAADSSEDLPQSLYIKEADLTSVTEQAEISQGMFRALSLFIQINYSLLASKPSCIVIDDIGEGLDYQRSSSIIKILIKKAETGLIQLIMTTNDEFIMNGVPLKYWSLIERTPGSAKLHNIYNSREKIEEFKFIGLNNFDLFTSEFLLQKKGDEEAE
ncbi:ATP-binding protein [Microcoleus vaginatus GB1-A2]|uniref:AAA family ATPase n=1 Tax=Microcoleus vaginatus TaxID=119532 RepID=UPI001686704C|nr:ATP-binding protein [Microcoleus sp. FACHB-61]